MRVLSTNALASEQDERDRCTTVFDLIALDPFAARYLHQVNERLQPITEYLASIATLHLRSSAILSQGGIGDFALLVASRSTATSTLKELERTNQLRTRCFLVLVVLVDDTLGSCRSLPAPEIPQGYYQLVPAADIPAPMEAQLGHLQSSLTAILCSLFGEGLICVDPADFLGLCVGTKIISYKRFSGEVNSVQLDRITAWLHEFQQIRGLFICINTSQTSLENWHSGEMLRIQDDICDTIPGIQFSVISLPFFTMKHAAAGSLDIFVTTMG